MAIFIILAIFVFIIGVAITNYTSAKETNGPQTIQKQTSKSTITNYTNSNNRKSEYTVKDYESFLNTKLENYDTKTVVSKTNDQLPIQAKSTADNPPIKFIDELTIPNEVLELLWIKGGPLNNYNDNNIKEQFINGIRISVSSQTEPSLIDISLPLNTDITNSDYIEDIGYYPSYERLSPKQRYVYLSWLQDISKPVAVGYVFIFYYGLERHLMFGKYKEAVKMINYLQQFHNNGSFYSYSTDAMLIGILKHNDINLLNSINFNNASNPIYALVKGVVSKFYSAEDIIRLYKLFGFNNNRYIKNQYDDFLRELKINLNNKYGIDKYPLPSNTIDKCNGNQLLVVANYSLMQEDRFAIAPDISTNELICKDLFNILTETHENIKIKNRNKRKMESNIKRTNNTTYAKVDGDSDLSNLKKMIDRYDIKNMYINVTKDVDNINLKEEIFISELIHQMNENKIFHLEGLNIKRMGDKTLSVDTYSGYIGKIKLQSNHYMQILKGMHGIRELQNPTLEECLNEIPAWIRRIKYCRRN